MGSPLTWSVLNEDWKIHGGQSHLRLLVMRAAGDLCTLHISVPTNKREGTTALTFSSSIRLVAIETGRYAGQTFGLIQDGSSSDLTSYCTYPITQSSCMNRGCFLIPFHVGD